MADGVLRRKVSRPFLPLLKPSRYKAAYGGRGSGKSHFFAEQIIQDSIVHKGLRTVCIREVQKSLQESAKRLLEDKIKAFGLGIEQGFEILKTEIRTPGDGIIIFQGMQDHTAESLKSLEGYSRAWVEEAQTLSARSLGLLRPTIRAENSELWFSWNPTRKSDPVDQMFRAGDPPTDSTIVKANWTENKLFPAVLNQERLDCLRSQPDQYGHIWDGDYATVLAGAYYAQSIAKAREEGRIGKVAADPLMTYRAYWDIGGTGKKSDATAIWIAQFVGREIRVLDYYEAIGQPLATHVAWLRDKGYGKALCVLPHDGEKANEIFDTTYKAMLNAAGFETEVVPNQGAGAATLRIEAARRLFPAMWFNAETCQPGLDALGWYHEKRDESRSLGLGPDHNWASHGADAFGMMCVAYEAPRIEREQFVSHFRPQGAWMA